MTKSDLVTLLISYWKAQKFTNWTNILTFQDNILKIF